MRATGLERANGESMAAPDLHERRIRAPRPAEPVADVGKMQALIERQYRANETLTALLRRVAGATGASAPVAIVPRVAAATLSQQPPRLTPAAVDPWWRSAPVAPDRPLWAMSGHEACSLVGDEAEVVGVTVFGLTGIDLDRVVGLVADEQRRQKNFRPVFLTDCPDFHAFVRRGYAFEYLSRFRGFVRSEEELARAARIEALSAKWGFTRIVDRDDVRSVKRNYPQVAAILQHNAGMSRACHQDRFAWIVETLRLALTGERYDIVEGLADYVMAFFDRLPKTVQIAAARMLCRKFVAFGETEVLRTFLFKNIAAIRKDDYLYTLFSLHCTPIGALSAEFAKLPSGKLNYAYIGKRIAGSGSSALPILMSASESGAVESYLLIANHFAAQGDAALYKMFLNRYIARDGGAALSRVSLKCDNVLDRLAFEERPPSRRQSDMISVVMSAYDAAGTIGYAARSVLAQTHGNLELLICDDGSTDGTAEILASLAARDPRVRLFRSKSRQGTYNIRNSMIAEARGRFVTFQDSDDFAFPDRLERQLAFLEQQNAAAVAAQWFRVTRTGEILFSTDHAAARLAVVSLLAPKAVFERFGPYRPARFGADTEFYEGLRMRLGVDTVKLLPVPLLFGLSSETSLTRSHGIEASEDGYRAPARRTYAAAAAKRRQIGTTPDEAAEMDRLLGNWNILMDAAGVEALTEGGR
jgi:hypothetical protein